MAKAQSFNIKMRDGKTESVEGLIVNNRWGIDKRTTETKRQTKDGEKVSLSSSFFLTHIPTGVLITNANTQKALRELVNRPDMIEEDDLKNIAVAVGKFWNERGWQG